VKLYRHYVRIWRRWIISLLHIKKYGSVNIKLMFEYYLLWEWIETGMANFFTEAGIVIFVLVALAISGFWYPIVVILIYFVELIVAIRMFISKHTDRKYFDKINKKREERLSDYAKYWR
jgi:hypothetical protein